MNELFFIVKDLGLGAIAVSCGIIALINGKDKVNKKDCSAQISKFNDEFTESQRQFSEINTKLDLIMGYFKITPK